MRILIAEDDLVSSRILQKAVEKFGHECLMAVDGESAWQLFHSTEVDVIISDWMMPGIDGMELCRRVRHCSTSSYTYFIFLTALSDKQHILTGMETGADDYLSKPLDPFELRIRLIAAERVTALHRKLASQRTELELLHRESLEQARRDPLTQLGNRLLLHEDLDILCGRVSRYSHAYCAALCDIDDFKTYNDHYGHIEGDEILRVVAKVIAHHCRSGDQAYRYGGEEFLVILPEQTLDSATIAMERMRKAVEDMGLPHEVKTPPIVTLSVGVASLIPGENKSIDDLLEEADDALYRAKRSGKNRVCVPVTTAVG